MIYDAWSRAILGAAVVFSCGVHATYGWLSWVMK